MRLRSISFCVLIAILLAFVAASTPANTPQQAAGPAAILCRAIEVQTDGAKRSTVVIFHHASEASRAALAEFLRSHSGAEVEIATGEAGASASRATVFRMKSCFGRGLLLLPSGISLKEGATFSLQLSEKAAGSASSSRE